MMRSGTRVRCGCGKWEVGCGKCDIRHPTGGHEASLFRARFGVVLSMSAVLLLCGACQLPYFLMAKEPKRKVAAEYDKLGGKTVALIVWADQVTLDEDYAARHRVADNLRYYIAQGVKDVKFVDIREITDFQEKSGTDWESLTNVQLGRRFKADVVLRVDLLEYIPRTRESEAVRRSRIRATVGLYNVADSDRDKAVYSTEVMATFPANRKTDVLDRSDADMLNGVLRVFAEKVATKFYEHEVSY